MGKRKGIWSSTRHFFSYLIHPAMSSSLPDIPELFTTQHAPPFYCAVSHWANYLQSRPEASNCVIKRVTHCKREAGKEHEFLVFEISYPGVFSNRNAVVVTHRNVSLSDGEGNPGISIQRKSSVLSPSSSPNPDAVDAIYAASKGTPAEKTIYAQFQKYSVLRTLEFPHDSTRPSAQHLCTLLQVTSVHARLYHTYQHQCYWFAHTVFEVLRKSFDATMTPGPAFQRCATYCSVGIPFADSVVQVHEAYKLAWVDFSAGVQANSEAREALECARAEGREDGLAEGLAEAAKARAEGLAEAAKARAEGLAEAEKVRAEGLAEAEKARAEGLAEAAKARAEVAAYEAERHELLTRLSVLERCRQQDLKPALAADATSSADI